MRWLDPVQGGDRLRWRSFPSELGSNGGHTASALAVTKCRGVSEDTCI